MEFQISSLMIYIKIPSLIILTGKANPFHLGNCEVITRHKARLPNRNNKSVCVCACVRRGRRKNDRNGMTDLKIHLRRACL